MGTFAFGGVSLSLILIVLIVAASIGFALYAVGAELWKGKTDGRD